MKKQFWRPWLFWQAAICFGVLLWIYILLDLLGNAAADTAGDDGWLALPPLAGSVRAAVTIIICAVAGLPVRLHAGIRKWWEERPLLPLAGVAAGILCFVLAFLPCLMDVKETIIDGELEMNAVPDYVLSRTGWFLIAFSVLHFSNSKVKIQNSKGGLW